MMVANDGSQLRAAICSGGNCMGYWQIGAVSLPPTGWTNPVVGIVYATATTASEGPIFANLTRASNVHGRVGATNFAAFMSCEGTNASEVNATLGGANDIDSTYPMSGVGIISTVTAGTRGRLGTVIDTWAGLVALATVTTYGSKTFCQFGEIILPWDGSTVPSAA